MKNSVCFTGYRAEKFSFELEASCPEYLNLVNKIKETIINLIKLGYRNFYTGGCNGFDMIVGQILIELKKNYKINAIVVMPYISFGRNFSKKWRNIRDYILTYSDEVIYNNDVYKKGCYQERNMFMVDRCNLIVTYNDGRKGGTLNTINYGKKKNKEIINLFEENKQLTLEL